MNWHASGDWNGREISKANRKTWLQNVRLKQEIDQMDEETGIMAKSTKIDAISLQIVINIEYCQYGWNTKATHYTGNTTIHFGSNHTKGSRIILQGEIQKHFSRYSISARYDYQEVSRNLEVHVWVLIWPKRFWF